MDEQQAPTHDRLSSFEEIEEASAITHPLFCDCCVCLSLEPSRVEDYGGELDEEYRDDN